MPIVGDDIKSQVGATITHRVLAKLFEDRGVVLDRTMQLNVGGNMDFMNMLERDRLESKKISKTQAVTSNVEHDLGKNNVHIGPSDYVAWLDDRKWAYVRLEGRAFGDVPLNLEYKLEVWDSPNSAGVIIDAVRAAKIAMDRGIGGPILSAVVVLHEVPAGAAPRRRGPRLGGGFHPRRDRALIPHRRPAGAGPAAFGGAGARPPVRAEQAVSCAPDQPGDLPPAAASTAEPRWPEQPAGSRAERRSPARPAGPPGVDGPRRPAPASPARRPRPAPAGTGPGRG